MKCIPDFITQLFQKGYFHLLSANGLMKIFGFSSQFIVAWLLTVDDLGRIKIIQSYLALAVILGGAGLNTSVLKLCSENRTIDNKKELFGTALIFSVLACLVTYLALVSLGYSGLLTNKKEIIILIPWFGIALFPQVTNQLLSAFLQALQQYKNISYIQIVTKSISVIMILLLTYHWLLYGYIVAYIAGMFLTCFVFIYFVKSLLGSLFKRNIFEYINNIYLHLRLSAYSLIGNLINQAGYHLDILFMASMVNNPYQIGQYSFAKIVIFAMGTLIGSTQQFLTPYFSFYSEDIPKLASLYEKAQLGFITVSVLIFIFCFLFYEYFVQLLFFNKYNDSVLYFKILLLGWLARTLYSLKGPLLLGIGRVDINAKIVAMAIPLHCMAMYFLIKLYSLVGAAVATSISSLLLYSLISYCFNKFFLEKSRTT